MIKEEEIKAETLAENEETPLAEAEMENGETTTAETIEETEKEDDATLNRLMRLQADFENFKKRSQKEKTEIYQYASENFATKLLPVMDNLERAEAALTDASEEAKSYVDGLEMVFKQLKDVLKEEGLEEIVCEGPFDANLHHGVAVGDDDEKEDQDIIDVFQKGYKFKGKVIRPAMVKVCSK
ncbi:nucleotide exchange factor GrpE [Acetobacterium woodii]|uniref:Protein GrpE n=1 Tax=Acetobacterium woodii (strain ATCC 29683 / DSM 1030 / JCM 2381 / KCTC 1655 / WB1) TaxID=931626 RepID=H6LFD0_ACEWD|nr:nucleotide exchange factor GrpE [Acetobacterium woodii]AFA49417.1 heat shock protein GrpE [Acetobacterium woodii DSM 1030]